MFRLPIIASLGCAVLASQDETSLLQQLTLKPKSDSKREQPVANLLAVAGNLLKNGATPDVVDFTRATLDEITGIVVPAIANASASDQTLLDNMYAQFEIVLAALEQGTALINQLNADERAHSAAHKTCRDEEAMKCTVKITCDYDLWDLWKVFVEEEEELRVIQTGIEGHFCPPDANGTLFSFRAASVPRMESFITQHPVVVRAEERYDDKVPQCEHHFTELDDKTAECDAHQLALENAACRHAVEVRRVREEFARDWHAALEVYERTMTEVHILQLDRIEEYKTLSVVECLLDRTTERNGRPCDESSDEITTEVTHCEEVRVDVDVSWLILVYREVPPVPPTCVDRDSVHGRCIPEPPPYPCQPSFLEQEYSGLPAVPQPEFHEENSHCNQRPACQPCLEMQEPETPMPSPGDVARSRCRRVMRNAPDTIARAMFGVHHFENHVLNVCEDYPVTDLYQADFQYGTYIITSPGIYRIQEDILMAPQTEHMMPPKDSTAYPMGDGYWLGFVAAIAVASDNVFLDLNDKTIAMSEEFLLRQRFFSVVQLGNRPFEASVGPPQFAALTHAPFWASNVVISDGHLGCTSHTGVHGWNNNNVWVDHVRISEFETAGIQINGARHAYITNTEIGPNMGSPASSVPVPGLATLSQALLLLRVIDGESIENEDVAFANLRAATERYINAYLTGGQIAESERIFVNPSGIPDGSATYGLLFHPPHLAIHDFAACPSFDGEEDGNSFGPLVVKDVIIRDLSLQTDEVVHMKSGGKPVMGPAGDVMQVYRMQDDDGNYIPNVLNDAQLALGRLKLAHESSEVAGYGEAIDADEVFQLFGATNMPAPFLAWTAGEKSWDTMVSEVGGQFVCLKDAMTHHNKGTMGIRIEYYHDVSLSGVQLRNFENVGQASEVSHCTGDDLVYTGNDARGVTFSHVSHIKVEDVTIQHMNSVNGHAYGVEERIEVNYDGTPDWTFEHITGALGSSEHDTGLNGMLSSDSEADNFMR
jgi:hypothetical protein